MWSINNQQGLLNSFTPNSELHGSDRIPNAFLYISFDASNDILSEFDSKLKNALYEKDKGPRDLLPVDKHALLSLKFVDVGPISWTKEYTGYTFIVHFGVSGANDIELTEAKVDKVTFTCLDGGSVKVKMRISAHPEEKQIGKLGTLNMSQSPADQHLSETVRNVPSIALGAYASSFSQMNCSSTAQAGMSVAGFGIAGGASKDSQSCVYEVMAAESVRQSTVTKDAELAAKLQQAAINARCMISAEATKISEAAGLTCQTRIEERPDSQPDSTRVAGN